MPYQSVTDLPPAVKDNLPSHAQEIYLAAFNGALEQYKDEEKARKVAWAAVKRKYHKNADGKWVKSMSEPSFFVPISTEDFAQKKALLFPYGKCIYFPSGKLTREDAEKIVDNFHNNVLERDGGRLPVNREHKRETGAIGEVVDLQLGDKGIVGTFDVEDEKGAGYRYVSPEIAWDWTHPFTGTKAGPVLMGAALTNYPRLLGQTAIFSDETQEWEEAEPSVIDVARQIAKEFTDSIREQIQEWRTERQEDTQSTPPEELGEGDKEDEMAEEKFAEQLAAEKAKWDAEFAEKLEAEKQKLVDAEKETTDKLAEKESLLTALSEEKAALEKAKADADAKVQEYAEKAATEERTRRLAEFSEIAEGLGVPVKAENFAETLMYFNDADQTEGKAHYELMLSVIKAKGNAAQMAALFGESGTDAVGDNIVSKFDALVEKRMQEHNEDISTASKKVIEENPGLYKEYDASRNSSAGEE